MGHGPAFKKGLKVHGVTSIHLYEMMCKILGLQPAINDGVLDSTRVFLAN